MDGCAGLLEVLEQSEIKGHHFKVANGIVTF